MNRKIMASLATMLLLLTCSFTVLADGFDKGRSGSISVTLNDQNEPLVDIGLSVYYVATVEADEGGFDLSLYTCTFGGGSRVTVRCNAVE